MPATTGMKGAGYYDEHSRRSFPRSRPSRAGWRTPSQRCRCRPRPASHRPGPRLRGGGQRRPPDGGRRGGAAGAHRGARADGLQRPAGQRLQPAVRQPGGGPGAGLIDAGVYPAAVAGSFYGPLLPPGTVHLAICFNAIHWLDRLPAVPMPDAIVYRRPRPGLAVSSQVSLAFSRQAEQDLVRLLECRARELLPVGTLLLASPGDVS